MRFSESMLVFSKKVLKEYTKVVEKQRISAKMQGNYHINSLGKFARDDVYIELALNVNWWESEELYGLKKQFKRKVIEPEKKTPIKKKDIEEDLSRLSYENFINNPIIWQHFLYGSDLPIHESRQIFLTELYYVPFEDGMFNQDAIEEDDWFNVDFFDDHLIQHYNAFLPYPVRPFQIYFLSGTIGEPIYLDKGKYASSLSKGNKLKKNFYRKTENKNLFRALVDIMDPSFRVKKSFAGFKERYWNILLLSYYNTRMTSSIILLVFSIFMLFCSIFAIDITRVIDIAFFDILAGVEMLLEFMIMITFIAFCFCSSINPLYSRLEKIDLWAFSFLSLSLAITLWMSFRFPFFNYHVIPRGIHINIFEKQTLWGFDPSFKDLIDQQLSPKKERRFYMSPKDGTAWEYGIRLGYYTQNELYDWLLENDYATDPVDFIIAKKMWLRMIKEYRMDPAIFDWWRNRHWRYFHPIMKRKRFRRKHILRFIVGYTGKASTREWAKRRRLYKKNFMMKFGFNDFRRRFREDREEKEFIRKNRSKMKKRDKAKMRYRHKIVKWRPKNKRKRRLSRRLLHDWNITRIDRDPERIKEMVKIAYKDKQRLKLRKIAKRKNKMKIKRFKEEIEKRKKKKEKEVKKTGKSGFFSRVFRGSGSK